MAIQYVRLEIVGRSKGMNACSRAAYNGNLKIKDHRINKSFNFLKNKTNVYHEVLLPKIANKEYKNIEVLMNEVEEKEHQKNSQLLKEYTLALPGEDEINLRHKIALTKLFIRKVGLARENLAIVIDIHKPKEGDNNWYSKILVTTRRFLDHGKSLGFKARDLNLPIRSNKGKSFVPTDSVLNNGKIWRDVQNSFFEFLCLELRVDEISNTPQEHIGNRKYGILAEQKRLEKVNS